DVPADSVVEEFQKGYRMGDTILRPSRVVVSAGPEETPEDTPGGDAAEEPGDSTSAAPEGAESDEDSTLVDL
ncbi:MAG: nucleotide exchange factor GrpE, partial [bacterium]|nr:nucleotide exchange factor GrpE [bacterium]